MPKIDYQEELVPMKAGVLKADIDEDKEADREIASAQRALLLSALTVTVTSPLILYIAYIFHFSVTKLVLPM
jgi:hypothetical protein